MNTAVTILLLATLLPQSEGGLVAYGVCQTGCNGLWVACVR